MSCRNFEAIITELAREQILDAQIKADAHSHLNECKVCAARLAAEQSLSAGLRAYAAEAVETEAGQLREASLVSAFRRSGLGVQRTAAVGTSTKAPGWSPFSLAAAATMLVVAAFALFEFVLNKRTEPVREATTNAKSPFATPPSDSDVQQNASTNDDDQLMVEPLEPASIDSGKRRGLIRDAEYRPRVAATVPAGASQSGVRDEIATDFLPLSYGANLSQFDDIQMVRVEVPRSMLQSLGLPMNVEMAGQRVKADVLLGHDGVARAIRFVK